MKPKALFCACILAFVSTLAHGQSSPFSNFLFTPQIFTTTGQTGTPIQLNGLTTPSTVGSSFTLGSITVVGTSLTTVTFQVLGSSDNGATYYPLVIYSVSTPNGTPATSVTTTGNALYQVSLAGLTHVKFATTGTFNATNVTITLTATPNGQLARSGSGSQYVLPGATPNSLGGVLLPLGQSSTTLSKVGITGAAGDLTGLAAVALSGSANDLTGLAAVAKSGAASDLTGLSTAVGGMNAATANALFAAPTPCTSGFFAGGVDVHGNSINCTAGGGSSYLGLFSANANQSSPGANDGIARTLALSGFGTGTVLVDPNYTLLDQSAMDNAIGARIGFIDMRQGGFRLRSISPSPTGTTGGSNVGGNSNFAVDCVNSQSLADTQGEYAAPISNTCMYTVYKTDVPGFSYGAIAPASPSGDYSSAVWTIDSYNYTAGMNHSLITAQQRAFGKGENNTVDVNFTYSYGGGDESAGEGMHDIRWVATVGDDFTGTLWSVVDTPASGYVQLYMNTSSPTLGTLRHLLDTTNGVITDTVTAVTQQGSVNALTMASSTYPVSTVITLGQDISPPRSSEQTKTSETFTVNTSVDLTSLVGKQFMFNGSETECSTIQSVGTFNSTASTQTVTAMMGEFHNSGLTMYIGGMACTFIIPDSSVMARTNNQHTDYYILGSTANNTLIEGRVMGANMDPTIGGIPGAVHIYHGARVLDVRCTSSCSGGAIPGNDDTAVKVERTGFTWTSSDNVLSGMIASDMNDTFYFNLTDNNPMSVGHTFWFYMNGAQLGGYAARDFMYIQNQMSESDYTYSGGPFALGNWFHWKGPIGGVFQLDNPLHGNFLTENYCGFTLVQSASTIKQTCASGSGATALTAGWNFTGDLQFISSDNPTGVMMSLGWAPGFTVNMPTVLQNNYQGAGTQSLWVKPHVISNSTPDFQVDGVSYLNGKVNVSGSLTMTGASSVTGTNGITTDTLTMPDATNCIIGTDNFGNFQCNPNSITATFYTATTIGGTVYGISQNGTSIGGLSNNLGALQLNALSGAGGQAGNLQLHADNSIISQSPMFMGNDGVGIAGTYDLHIVDTGSNQLVVETSSATSYAAIRMAAPGASVASIWQFGLGGNGVGGGLANNFYVYDQTNTKTAMTIVANTENILPGGDISPLHDTLASGATCGTHSPNALWADDGFIYHCNNAGTAASRVAISTF